MKPSKKVQRGFAVQRDWADSLNNVSIVLVGITHPGNIGAIARVMKNMGLRSLKLVSSRNCGPETDAFAMASGAYDIVRNAEIFTRLDEALPDCLMAVATSGRLGRKRSEALTPEEVIPDLMQRSREGPVACIFGRESRGLTNEEMKLCTHHLIIPTDADFPSMNVAHACAVVAYEIFKVSCHPMGFQVRRFRPAPLSHREQMFEHIQTVLIRAGFLDADKPLRMMRDIRRILNSANMEERDVKIIRGLFRKIDNLVRTADERIRVLEGRGPEG
jgi:TrmH family RNA methyltransferase